MNNPDTPPQPTRGNPAWLDELARESTVNTIKAETPPDQPAPANAKDTDDPPTRIGKYRIVGQLGGGGMGVVYRAHDSKLGRDVALKVLRSDLANSPGFKERFLREAHALAQVENDHVVKIYEADEDAGNVYLAMELLPGQTLADRLTRGAIPLEEVVRIGRDTARGLAAIHAKGLVHRDIKPGNLWLDGDGRVKIIDFGLARRVDGADKLTRSGFAPGTPHYMAPEQARGEEVDPRADLFSLGIVLYRTATGQLPFAGTSPLAIFRAITDAEPIPPHHHNRSIPCALSGWIIRLLAKEPSARPTASAAAEALGGITIKSETEASIPHGIASSIPTTRPAGGSSWRVRVAAALAALAAVPVAWWMLTRPTEATWVPGTSKDDEAKYPRARGSSFKGRIDVLVERSGTDGKAVRLRLNDFGALPLKQDDRFRIEARVEPPAYVYIVWIDPGHDITPVYPWDPKIGWESRPATEDPKGRVDLPRDVSNWYRAPRAKPGVATMVMFSRQTPLDVPDEEVRKWFAGLPELPLPPDGETGVVWFDNYRDALDPDRPRTFDVVASDDPFVRWQGELEKVLGAKVAFQSSVSFARTGGK